MLKKLSRTLSAALMVLIPLSTLTSNTYAGPDPESEVAEVLEWSDLIPRGFDPDRLFEQYQQKYNIDALKDNDPRVVELMSKLDEIAELSPVNATLEGRLVRIPGYVVPLETDGRSTSEFLLVPYFGACIHVPPPPLNQTVHVKVKHGKSVAIRGLFDVVWVTGVIKTERFSTELADAGYAIDATEVTPYQ